MIKVIIAFVFMLTGIATTAQRTAAPAKSAAKAKAIAWKSYTDSAKLTTVYYPAAWSLRTTNPKVLYTIMSPLEGSEDKFGENVNIIAKYTEMPGTNEALDAAMDGVKEQLSNTIDNFTVTYIKPLTWNGVPAREIAYTGTSSGYAVSIIQRLCVKKKNLFVMTYTAEGEKDDTYVEAARLMFTKLIIR